MLLGVGAAAPFPGLAGFNSSGLRPMLTQFSEGASPIVIVTVVWGEGWCGKTIQVWCDNVAAMSTVNHGSSANHDVMHLARCLAFAKAKFEFELLATHLPGTRNTIVDALSRNNMALFHSLLPQADQEPTLIPDFWTC